MGTNTETHDQILGRKRESPNYGSSFCPLHWITGNPTEGSKKELYESVGSKTQEYDPCPSTKQGSQRLKRQT